MKNIFAHRCYELTEKDNCIAMSYYRFNRKEILQKAKERYSKEKTASHYLQNKAIKEKSKNGYKTLSKEEKDKIKEYQRKRYQQLIQYKKEALQNELCFCSV